MNTVTRIEDHAPVRALVHPEFPDYVVYADGSVVSHVHSTPRRLSPIRMGKYVGLQLRDRFGVCRKIYLHRLVTETFRGQPAPGQEARHRDGNRQHNAESNLHWGTRAENMRDKDAHGTSPKGMRHPGAKLTDAAVIEMRAMRSVGASLPELMAKFGVSRMTCWRAVTGRLWSHI